ncbi:MAG TPA: ABC transporter ATP-binding protein [Candidatus Xenobia bacterium]|nr:ABC transporter ATP-binding protein [Candidatus Xenobia bacterium]
MPSIAARNLSKMYKIYARPADRLKEMLLRGRKVYHHPFWALRNLAFEVEPGTTLGVIGANGSGKSTLLQLLAGTLQPSTGSVEVEGRVAALLELGSGFNPEHTGRENAYLAAAIQGIPRDEMKERMALIERFAEIGEFIDQPVKTYSTGMFVRLAFAVAIHVDPDILLIDEVLAVGDAIFANRCVRRIQQLQQQGVTIVFVSHDVGAVKMLCNRALLLNQGELVVDGDPNTVVNRYQEIVMARERSYEQHSGATAPLPVPEDLAEEELPPLTYSHRHGDGAAEILKIQILNAQRQPIALLQSGQSVTVRVLVRFYQAHPDPVVGILIRNRLGVDVYGTNTELEKIKFGPCHPGEIVEVAYQFDCWLAPGEYTLTTATHTVDGASHDWLDDVLAFRVVDSRHTAGLANLHARVAVQKRAGRVPAVTGSTSGT